MELEYIIEHAMGGSPILSVMIYTPIIGALLIMLLPPAQDTRMIQGIATLFTCLTFVWSVVALKNFQVGTHLMQLTEHHSWIRDG